MSTHRSGIAHSQLDTEKRESVSIKTWFTLGRTSNLPTVFANVFTGIALSYTMITPLHPGVYFLSLVAMSLAYLAGMFLNDVFDAEFDKEHRSNRPIPNGEISTGTVANAAIILLVLCFASTVGAAILAQQSVSQALFAVTALVGCIVLYDAWHKNNPISPVIMGACRALVYVSCALIVSKQLSLILLGGAAVLWLYVIGLTYTAKQEHLNHVQNAWPLIGLYLPMACGAFLALHKTWVMIPLALYIASVVFAISRIVRRNPGDVPVAVVTLIASMALWDAMLLFAAGFPALAMMAIGCWLLTLAFQHWVSGT